MSRFIILIVIVVIICLVLYYYLNREMSLFTNDNSQEIPKIIWTYWHAKELPEFVELCINSWKKHNPSWQINILNDDNLNDYIPEINLNKL